MKRLIYILMILLVNKGFSKTPSPCTMTISLSSIVDNRCMDGTGDVIVNYTISWDDASGNASVSVSGLPSGVSSTLNPSSFSSAPNNSPGSVTLSVANGNLSTSLINFTITTSGGSVCNTPIEVPAYCGIDFSCSENEFPNLVLNGDFEVGDSGNSTLTGVTSDYTYESGTIDDGKYAIRRSVPLSSVKDHTYGNGEGYFMFAHPIDSFNNIAWQQNVSGVNANSYYEFSVWIAPMLGAVGPTNDEIKLLVDNEEVASVSPTSIPENSWYKLTGVWSSDGLIGTNVDLKIFMENQDDIYRLFIDDISFKEKCKFCADDEAYFQVNGCYNLSGATYEWNFGDGSSVSSTGAHIYNAEGTYTVTLTISKSGCSNLVLTNPVVIESCVCPDCVGSFTPEPGERYVLSGWVKEDVTSQVATYIHPTISLDFSNPNPGTVLGPFKPKGKIIEGWQKIEEVITIPADSWYVDIYLNNAGTNDVYFDDIRISPFKSSLKTYVYDPVTLRLAAELDDNNYATFYQYDEEGKLIRIKKETERGVETIQETRESSYKQAKSMDERLNNNSNNDE